MAVDDLDTPAKVAQAVIDKIEQYPENFNMNSWYDKAEDDDSEVVPGESEENLCGTTMCIAGWVCHVLGYTLTQGVRAYRVASDQSGAVDTIARRALGEEGLFYWDAKPAMARLREIAREGE